MANIRTILIFTEFEFALPSEMIVLMTGPHVRDLAMTAQERTEPNTNRDEW